MNRSIAMHIVLMGCVLTNSCHAATRKDASWVERTLKSLSLEQKIAQLFMVAVVADPHANQEFMQDSPYQMDPEYVESLVRTYKIGGIIFLGKSSLKRHVHVTKRLQSLSTIPLLVAADFEWGLEMRIDDAIAYPKAMCLGAIPNNESGSGLIYELGRQIGRECKAIGVHINLAPVADVQTNPANPVINTRSFGADARAVTQKSIAFMRGLQDEGIHACAKHFPGHGDTHQDSHEQLPTITHDRGRLHNVEFIPFAGLIREGVKMVMTAHISVPALDPSKAPASLSPHIINQILRKQLGFKGLVITDGLGMKAVADGELPGTVELRALQAGNDIVLAPVDVPAAIAAIKRAIKEGTLSERELDLHVLRILETKEMIRTRGGFKWQELENEITETPYIHTLKDRILSAAITTRGDVSQYTLAQDETPVIIHLGACENNTPEYTALVKRYPTMRHACLAPDATHMPEVQAHETAIVCIHPVSKQTINAYGMQNDSVLRFGITQHMIDCVEHIVRHAKHTMLMLFGNAYGAVHFNPELPLILAYQDTPEAHVVAQRIICSIIRPRGILPVRLPKV